MSRGFSVGLSVLVVVLATVGAAETIARYVVKETLDRDLLAMVAMMRSSIDPQPHATPTQPDQHGGPAYQEIGTAMRRLLLAAPHFKYASTMRQGPDGLRFIVDAAAPGDADGDGVDDQVVLGELYEDPDPGMLVALATRGPALSPEPQTDIWGTSVSGFLPLYGPDGTLDGLVGMDDEAETHLARLARIHRISTIAGVGRRWRIGWRRRCVRPRRRTTPRPRSWRT